MVGAHRGLASLALAAVLAACGSSAGGGGYTCPPAGADVGRYVSPWCAGQIDAAGTTPDAAGATPDSGASADAAVHAPPRDPEDRSAAEVCGRWQSDRAVLAEPKWSGNVASCDPGDIDPEGRARALRQVNLIRWLAGLAPVTSDPDRDASAQACALMMLANGKLSHAPVSSWSCYREEGATAAEKSNLSSTPAVQAIIDYMIDAGAHNALTLGHRRWLLSNSLGPIGIGSTYKASCLWVIGGIGQGGRSWTAWPPPGYFPMAANASQWSTMDVTGWSIQSDLISLAKAQVRVAADGVQMPVQVRVLKPYYGSTHAISVLPVGWKMTAGKRYDVEVTGISKPISYSVLPVDCTGH